MSLLTNFAAAAGAIAVPHLTVDQVILNVTNIFMFAMGIFAVIVIIIAGFMFVTGGSDPAAVTRARNAILYSVIGLIVVITAKIIVSFIIGRF